MADKEQRNDYLAELCYLEYSTAKNNQDQDMADFKSNVDTLDGIRSEKNYEWMSDISTHDYTSIFLTEASTFANQGFATRDFVDPFLEGDKPEDMKKCSAAKKVINKMLNNREIFHYQKYMRGRMVNTMAGAVHAICWWDKDVEMVQQGTKRIPAPKYLNPDGSESEVPTDVVQLGYKEVPNTQKIIRKDRFNYEILDPRNVFYANNYCYSIQEKDWIIIRSEETYETLLEKQKENGYINLDKVKELVRNKTQQQTETNKETYNETRQDTLTPKPVLKYFDVLTRFGKQWAKVTKRNEGGYPEKITSGWDELGDLLPGAELIESITTVLLSGSTKILIRFQPQPYRDSKGNTYRPIIRGLCYIHPTRDVGMGDGKYARELQVFVDDTINMSNDRVHLATMPTLIGRRQSMEDNDTVYFEPEHTILVDDPATDIQEVKIRDNVQGALQQASLGVSKMQQLSGIWPTTMGGMTEKVETATAIAGSETRTNMRSGYKSLTHEYTYSLDFYWMVLQMTYQFAEPETAMELMGDEAQFFDPDPLFTYQPVSSNVEQEQQKDKKVQRYQQLLNTIIGIQSPALAPIVSYIIGRQCVLLGDEYRVLAKMLENLSKAPISQGGEKGENAPDMMTQNEQGLPVGAQEAMARNM